MALLRVALLVAKLELDPTESLTQLESMFVNFDLTAGDHDVEGEKSASAEDNESDIHVEGDE